MAHLLRFSGGDPVVRAEAWSGTPQPALTARDGARWAVAFVRPTHTHRISLMFRGDVELLREMVGSTPFAPWIDAARSAGADAVTLPRGAEGLGGLLAAEGGRWEFMSTTQVVDVPLPEGTVELGASERGEVEALLEAHNPGTDGQPFARPSQRWVGVRDRDGGLSAVACCEPELSGAPVLTGITVTPEARGRGLARGLTAELTRRAIADHGWCTLGMYSHNDRARGVYRSLGSEIHAEWTSGRLTT